MTWNGLDLQTRYSTKLSDTSAAGKARILDHINDGLIDIGTRFPWPFLRKKGKKTLTQDAEEQDITLGKPDAPTASLTSGGSLTDGSVFKAKVTFYEDVSGLESVASNETSSVTSSNAGGNQTLSLSDIPTSSDPLVTARKIYVDKDGGGFYLAKTISDNTTTTTTVTSNPTTTKLPPNQHLIKEIENDPFIESNRVLKYVQLHQILEMIGATTSGGTPQYWADIEEDRLYLYPRPNNSTTVLSFYYFKIPHKVSAEADSVPDLPEWTREVLDAFVVWKEYEYQDLDGQESKKQNYYQLLENLAGAKLRGKRGPRRVSSVTRDSDGDLI